MRVKGLKIAIIDTGVDQTHPALQDSTLPPAPNAPACGNLADAHPSDCAFINSKVIVARSYIAMQGAGSDSKNPAADSKPDDFSPRDHVGHGTNTSSTAAGNTATGAVTINGMAPKAYIGSYRIFGSPGMIPGGSTDAIIAAAEDAIKDGMDVLTHRAARADRSAGYRGCLHERERRREAEPARGRLRSAGCGSGKCRPRRHHCGGGGGQRRGERRQYERADV